MKLLSILCGGVCAACCVATCGLLVAFTLLAVLF